MMIEYLKFTSRFMNIAYNLHTNRVSKTKRVFYSDEDLHIALLPSKGTKSTGSYIFASDLYSTWSGIHISNQMQCTELGL